jgi:two-component system nitrate/nitrite response regulator NarL
MRLVVRSIERAIGSSLRFLEASDGERGAAVALRERPDAVIVDEIASRAGAFALARTVRGDPDPYRGVIVIVLERRQDSWLARWSGADAWFVKPVDPFEVADRLLELVEGRTQKETA